MDQQVDSLNHQLRGTCQGSGLYVDVENLQSGGQVMVEKLVEDWPPGFPAVSRLTLHVRADQEELWKLWAADRFRDLVVSVKGTQHFSKSSTKNSADIAIATNAMADLILKRVTHVAVFSDDSDFISLYVAIRDELDVIGDHGVVPFLWVVTDREGSLSTTVKQFFPKGQLHVVSAGPSSTEIVAEAKSTRSGNSSIPADLPWSEMAKPILQEISVGEFKSKQCQAIIKKHWPEHPLANAGGPSFGTDFKKNIWPVLQKHGVMIIGSGKAPIRYRMTAEAKDSLQ